MSPQTQENDFSGTLEDKVNRLIFYATRHSMVLSSQQASVEDVQKRLQTLEETNAKRTIVEAVAEERQKATLKEISELRDAVNAMKGVVTKAAWIIIGAVLLAVARFMLSGGLVGVTT